MSGKDRGDWCILRTAGPRTLPLVRSLQGAGVEAWTPVREVVRRLPRSQDRKTINAPLIPTFVFARARHLADLLGWMSDPRSPHPSFSIFRHIGRIPLIDDREMRSLRDADDEAKRRERERQAEIKSRRRYFPVGEPVRVTDGAFHGLTGTVLECDGKAALIAFKTLHITIASFLLESEVVEAPQPGRPGAAAQAASAS